MGLDKIKLAVLISGRGSNLQALIDACAADDFPAGISLVISNRPGVYGLERAENAGIPTALVDHKNFVSRETFEQALLAKLQERDIDLVCLAGFMRILSADFIRHFEGRIINIHPSLLPRHKGLDAQTQALAAGDSESGCTVHYVVPEMDSGPVIVQKRVPILPGDTEQSLSERILEQEHIAYPEAVKIIAGNSRKD